MKTELSFNALIFSSQQINSVLNFWGNSELDLLFNSGFDSGGLVLDLKNRPVESLVFLGELKDAGVDFRGNSELDGVVDGSLGGGLLHLVESDFTLLDIVFGFDQV